MLPGVRRTPLLTKPLSSLPRSLHGAQPVIVSVDRGNQPRTACRLGEPVELLIAENPPGVDHALLLLKTPRLSPARLLAMLPHDLLPLVTTVLPESIQLDLPRLLRQLPQLQKPALLKVRGQPIMRFESSLMTSAQVRKHTAGLVRRPHLSTVSRLSRPALELLADLLLQFFNLRERSGIVPVKILQLALERRPDPAVALALLQGLEGGGMETGPAGSRDKPFHRLNTKQAPLKPGAQNSEIIVVDLPWIIGKGVKLIQFCEGELLDTIFEQERDESLPPSQAAKLDQAAAAEIGKAGSQRLDLCPTPDDPLDL